jgi:hypothetical protein
MMVVSAWESGLSGRGLLFDVWSKRCVEVFSLKISLFFFVEKGPAAEARTHRNFKAYCATL